jgi:hypothetical protein
MSNNIPEVIREDKYQVECVVLRTVIKRDVYDRLKLIAQNYATGNGHWDFGVAIQLLLDNYENTRLQIQNEKLDLILNLMSSEQQDQQAEPEEKFVEMLGGSKIKI